MEARFKSGFYIDGASRRWQEMQTRFYSFSISQGNCLNRPVSKRKFLNLLEKERAFVLLQEALHQQSLHEALHEALQRHGVQDVKIRQTEDYFVVYCKQTSGRRYCLSKLVKTFAFIRLKEACHFCLVL